MDVSANGKPVTLPEGASVLDLVNTLGLGARRVVVERNGEPIARTAFGMVRLQSGDRIEVVRAVPGG